MAFTGPGLVVGGMPRIDTVGAGPNGVGAGALQGGVLRTRQAVCLVFFTRRRRVGGIVSPGGIVSVRRAGNALDVRAGGVRRLVTVRLIPFLSDLTPQ
ncbi:hypothetical protein [Streptomyces tsukubensis]|uniref:Uncharacterized protein n=1 Tax=Streptomyces tsukubensis TaxID=83656 RepID=A0A1V4A6A5_9ACTN|nr:hypothetical protein [Streptomyces tsukubensis]OON76462.1 hypothetical protein B1H18_21260 [Streptomyces tsukubensis]